MKGIEFLILSALILANLMFTFDTWYHLLNYKDTKVKKNEKHNSDHKFKCITCKYNNEAYRMCSHPKGNCYDAEEAKIKWEPKENIN